jgi:hypothetical protein
VAAVVGVLLLAAAGLKVHGVATAPVSPAGIFSTAVFQVCLIEFELFVGLWLLSGARPIAAWLTTLLAFSAFAGVSLYQGWLGQASCGCFGKLLVNLWVAFGIDGAVVAFLLVGRPELRPLWVRPRSILAGLAVVMAGGLAGVVLTLVLLGLTLFRFGSVEATLAAIRGEPISLRPTLIDVGNGEPGDERDAVLELVNHFGYDVRVLGGTADCSCVATVGLPVSIPDGETRAITVKVHLSGGPGLFTHQALVWTDAEEARTLRFILTGRTMPPAQGAERTKAD